MNRNGFAAIVGIIILAILAIGAGGYFVVGKKLKLQSILPPGSSQLTASTTQALNNQGRATDAAQSSLKTFKSDTFGMQITYSTDVWANAEEGILYSKEKILDSEPISSRNAHFQVTWGTDFNPITPAQFQQRIKCRTPEDPTQEEIAKVTLTTDSGIQLQGCEDIMHSQVAPANQYNLRYSKTKFDFVTENFCTVHPYTHTLSCTSFLSNGLDKNTTDAMLEKFQSVAKSLVFYKPTGDKIGILQKIQDLRTQAHNIISGHGTSESDKTAQEAYEKNNPLPIGEKIFDFSGPVLFDARKSAKIGNPHSVIIKGNKVVWSEHTREAPPYPENIWDVFLFEFFPEKSFGRVTQVTHFTHSDRKTPSIPTNIGIYMDQPYWVYENVLYSYNPSTQETKILKDNVRSVLGSYGDWLILTHPYEVNQYGAQVGGIYYYRYNLKTDKEERLNLIGSTAIIDGPYICYVYDATVRRFNIESKADEFLRTESDQIIGIGGCRGNWLAYSVLYPRGLRVYRIGDTGNIPIFSAQVATSTPIPGERGQNQLIGNMLYYSVDDRKVNSKNLVTGEEGIIIDKGSGPNSLAEDWTIDGNYIAYLKGTGMYMSELYLQRIK